MCGGEEGDGKGYMRVNLPGLLCRLLYHCWSPGFLQKVEFRNREVFKIQGHSFSLGQQLPQWWETCPFEVVTLVGGWMPRISPCQDKGGWMATLHSSSHVVGPHRWCLCVGWFGKFEWGYPPVMDTTCESWVDQRVLFTLWATQAGCGDTLPSSAFPLPTGEWAVWA